jgi:hypothetical protein
MIGLGFFALGALTTLILTSIALSKKNMFCNTGLDSCSSYTLDNGKCIRMWRGFVFPDNIFVCAMNKDGSTDGDGVVFDKEGNIIVVNKNVEKE